MSRKRKEIDIQKVVEMREKGKSLTEIAYHFGCSPTTICSRLKNLPKEEIKEKMVEEDEELDTEIPLTDDTKWQKPLFYTSSLALAGALCLEGIRLIKIEADETNKYMFFFEDTIGVEGIKKSFWDRKLQVDARTYNETIKDLRGEAHKISPPANEHRQFWGTRNNQF